MKTTTLLNNRYQIQQTLGRGGFGETFLAIDTHLPSGKKCVIKQLKPIIHEPTLPQWMCDRFDQEARILETLGENSQQIPCLYAYFQENNNFYLVQEWIEGQNLTELLQSKGVFSEAEVEKFLLEILPVIEFIHSQKIIHRDIKPDNIIYRLRDNLPVLIDFGVVKEALTTSFNPQGSSPYSIAIGTPGYMAGEQAAGRPIFSSDLYGLGLTAIYLLTGKPPQVLKTDSSSGEILWRQELPDLHSNLAGVIDRVIRFNPRERFSSATEMLSALRLSQINYSTAPTIPLGGKNQNQISNHSQPNNYSDVPTIAVGGKNQISNHSQPHSNIKTSNNPTAKIHPSSYSQQPTVAFESLPANDSVTSATEEKKTNLLLAFLPLIGLSLIAIASFWLGYNIIVDKNRNSIVDNSEPSVENILPNQDVNENVDSGKQEEKLPEEENNQTDTPIAENQPEENNQTESEFNRDTEEIQPESPEENKPIETSPPETINSNPSNSTNSTTIIGTSATELIRIHGEPDSKEQGYWNNTTKWIYFNKLANTKRVIYIIDDTNSTIKEIQMVFTSNSTIDNIFATFNQLTQSNMTSNISELLQSVVEKQTDLRSFNQDNIKGMIQRKEDSIYLHIWERNFH